MALAEREIMSFVGRRNELDGIVDCILNRASDRPSMVAISGPAGIGKSCLAAEAAKIVELKGYMVASVSCGQESPFPYAPFRELVERLRRTPGSVSSPFRDDKALGSKDGILLAWESYLAELSRQKPLLIVLDDLQKADSSTVRLLDFLVRSADKEGPRFLCTFCKEEIMVDDEGHSNINDFISNASLDGLCRSVELGGLSPEDTVKVVVGWFQLALPKNVVDKVVKSSRGNPLMAVESVKSIASMGYMELRDGVLRCGELSKVPMTFGDAVKHRLDVLKDPQRQMIYRAASLGSSTDVFTLAKAVGARPDEVTKMIREVYKLSALIDCHGSEFRFPHKRVQKAVQNLIPATERTAVYRSATAALESEGYGEEGLGELSWQWHQVGDNDRCLRFSLLAGRICSVWGAHLESKLYFGRVLQLVGETGRGDIVLESYEAMGDANFGLGRNARALECYDKAINRSSSSDRARLLRKKSSCTKNKTTEKGNDLSLSLILQALIESGDDYETAECKSSIAAAIMAKGDMEGAEKLCQASMKVFKDHGAVDRLAREMMQYGDLLLRQGKADQAIDMLTHAIRIAQEHPNFGNEVDANEALGIAYLCKGQVEKAIPVFDHCMEISRRAGDHNRTEMIQFDKTFAFDLAGDISKAREMAVEANHESLKRGVGPPWQDVVLAHIEQRGGDLAAAERLADSSLKTIDGNVFEQPAIGTLAVAVKASVLSRKKEYINANEMFQSALPKFRGTRFGPLYEATVHAWFAESLAEQGKMEQAVEEYRKARSLFEGFGNSLSTSIIDKDINLLSAKIIARQ
ncbi:MAG: tetratricopeptide repeat protein [Methanomassiliicoccales archaeon]